MQTQVLAVALKVTEMRSGPGEEETVRTGEELAVDTLASA